MIRSRATGGYTLVELLIAGLIALVVVLALGALIIVNQRAWEWGRDKTVLQQNTTEALEQMARSVRAANRLEVPSSTEFRTNDETGALVHTYRRVAVGADFRLQQDGADLVARPCTGFTVTPDNDSTSLTLVLELEDRAGNRVAAQTRSAIRNQTFEF